MPKEKELFRINLERLDQAFPNKEILTIQEFSKYCGKSYRTIKKMIDPPVTKAKAARYLS